MPFDTKDPYEGMSGQVWGSHIYYESTKKAYEQHGITDRPIALSRDTGPNWKAPDPEGQCLQGAGSPAHHRWPVWWTGDGVPLMASVGSMVEEAVHDMRAFVHSDCGGHGLCQTSEPHVKGRPPPPPDENKACRVPTDATLLRWTAHCVFGTVVRFHQGDHRWWLRSPTTQASGRSYLNMRYKMAPSLIAAGHVVQRAGFPLTARCDLIWPQYAEAKDPSQYIHLNATLIAPLEGEPAGQDWKNASGKPAVLPSSRSVWLPPGEWQDGWSGATVTGPKKIGVKPTESAGVFQIPMWHKRGGLLVLAHEGKLRIGDQDWTSLVVEGFPASTPSIESREIYEQDSSTHYHNTSTTVELGTSGDGKLWVSVSASNVPRLWVVRLHLRPGEQLNLGESDSKVMHLHHIHPAIDCAVTKTFFPFGGAGTAPACSAGPVAEFRIDAPPEGLRVEATLGSVVATR
jgi:alpha-glucosidase (family GH31 glycosyl hydrolase)